MKKVCTLLCTIAMALMIVSCGNGNKKPKIGILAPAVTHGWVAGVAFHAEQACKEMGDKIEYKVCTSESAEQMTAQIEELQAWGVDTIVAFPQWKGMEAPIKRAIKAGVKVVNFDIEIKTPGIYRVSGDNESMGVESAKYLVEKLGPKATVVALPVPGSGSVSELRMKGFNDTIKKIAPDMTIITRATKFTQEDGLKDFADVLTKNPKIDGVYSLDDETSMGVLQAIKEAKRTDVKVVTGGGGSQKYFKLMPEYKDIWVQTALYSPEMVKDAVAMAYELAQGKKVEPAVKIIPTKVVDRTNCKDHINPNSPY